MAKRFDSFGLTDLVAKPEDAFRLADLILAEGQRIPGYRGDYYRYYLGDAVVVLRTMPDSETGEPMILGMDTHAVSDCVWGLDAYMQPHPQPVEGERPNPLWGEPDDFRGDPMERLVTKSETTHLSESMAVVNTVPISLLNAEVLPVASGPMRLNMAAFPDWVEYFANEADYIAAQEKRLAPDASVMMVAVDVEEKEYATAYQEQVRKSVILSEGDVRGIGSWASIEKNEPLDKILLRGVVKDAKVGETYLGMEPLTKFLKVTVTTRLGDVELCHPFELVAEDQKDNVKTGAIVSCVCTLSGDAACGEYAGGVVFAGEQNLALLRDFFSRGDIRRLRPVMRSDCAVTFLENRQEGIESALALLDIVGDQLCDAGLWRCDLGTVTGVEQAGDAPPIGRTGQRCLLLGDGRQYAFLVLLDMDSVGRIRGLVITNDSRYDCEPDKEPV